MSISWGILGTGNIAHLFASDLALLPQADVVAVGSRSRDSAEAFGDEFDIPHRHASYDALVADDAVDVVYVASPHAFHAEHTTMAVEAGRAVLCEKPLTLSVAEAENVIATARAQSTFLMEALWTRFLPVFDDVRQCLRDGAIGPPQIVTADIGAPTPYDPHNRLFAPHLGGGALLDLGIYPLFLIVEMLGMPDDFVSAVTRADTGVDAQCSGVLRYDSGSSEGAHGVWTASLRADAGRTCSIAGPDGRLEGARSWWKGAPFTLTRPGGSTETFARPYEGNGYQFEAAHVMRCLRKGRTESPDWPLDASLDLLRLLDAHRADWGLTYPTEADAPDGR